VIARNLIPRDALPGNLIPASVLLSLVHGSGLIATACVVAGGLLLVVRRFAGAIPAAAEPGVLLTATLAAALLVLVVDVAVRTGSARGLATLARCGLAAGAAALLVPPRATTPVEWAAVAAAATVLGAVIIRDPSSRPRLKVKRGPVHHGPLTGGPGAGGPVSRDALARGPATLSHRSHVPAAPAALTDPRAPLFSPELSGTEVVRQRFERRETTAGDDTLVGLLTITVPTGAKLASGHVGFCPSFRQLPTVEVTTEYDGVEAVVAVGDLVPWGVRIDCRLAEPAEEDLEIPVMLTARVEG
jgi:hypothetical protein